MQWQKILAQNKFRWLSLCVSVSIIILWGYSKCSQHWRQFQELYFLEKQLMQQNTFPSEEKDSVNETGTIINQDQKMILQNIVSLAQTNKIKITNLQIGQPQNKNGLLLKLWVEVGFEKVLYFLQVLYAHGYPLVLQNYSFSQLSNQKLTARLEIVIMPDYVFAQKGNFILDATKNNLFCVDKNAYTNSDVNQDEISSQLFSIYEMRWTGMLRKGARREALLMLPNGQIINIKEGAVVGLEKGIVGWLDEESLRIILPNHEQVTISKGEKE